jgi:hypothetical protein
MFARLGKYVDTTGRDIGTGEQPGALRTRSRMEAVGADKVEVQRG